MKPFCGRCKRFIEDTLNCIGDERFCRHFNWSAWVVGRFTILLFIKGSRFTRRTSKESIYSLYYCFGILMTIRNFVYYSILQQTRFSFARKTVVVAANNWLESIATCKLIDHSQCSQTTNPPARCVFLLGTFATNFPHFVGWVRSTWLLLLLLLLPVLLFNSPVLWVCNKAIHIQSASSWIGWLVGGCHSLFTLQSSLLENAQQMIDLSQRRISERWLCLKAPVVQCIG